MGEACVSIYGRQSKVSLGARGTNIGSHRLRYSRSLFVTFSAAARLQFR
jgi:hypothetical protein